jgi:uncharacterized membrane protein
MEAIAILLAIAFIVFAFVLPIVAFARSGEAQRKVTELQDRLSNTMRALGELRERIAHLESREVRPAPQYEQAAVAEVVETKEEQPAPQVESEPIAGTPAYPWPEELKLPPPLPKYVAASMPAVAQSPVNIPRPPQRVVAQKPPVLNLEQFLGVKLFAWLGGLALFFGIGFFIKYSFEHNLIPPAARVAIGFVIGAGLLVAGVFVHRKEAYTVLAQTFCASGVLILYAVSFGAHALYHLFGAEPGGAFVAFALMALITIAAFLLAVRLNALVVAVLGMVGGFLTPILCSTGRDNPFGLFGYIALLDIGLLMVAKHKRWLFLSSLGAAGTVLMQLGWFQKFFERGHYFEGSATLIPMGIVIFFIALFTVAAWRAREKADGDLHPLGATLGLCGFGLLTAFVFLGYDGITSRTFLLYGYTFLINISVLVMVFLAPRLNMMQLGVGLATFLHLSIWTMQKLKPEMLGSALVVYLVFGIIHAAFPLVWRRLRDDDLTVPRAFSPWFPPLVILLMLLPVQTLDEVSIVIWPAILLADLCVIAAAIISGALMPVIAALVLTLMVVSAWLFKVPPQITALPSFLFVLGGFAAVFAVAGCWLTKRYSGVLRRSEAAPSLNDQIAASLPVLSAALPFLLLIMATLRLPVLDPTPVFGLGLLLVLLLLGLAKIARISSLPLASLACMVALEAAWHGQRFNAEQPWTPLCWYVGMHLLFTIYPFVFRYTFRQSVLPWAASAASGIGHFILIFISVKAAFPAMAGQMGLLPAVFALPGIVSLLGVLRFVESDGDARNAQLAWFGGVMLLFITLIFPIQFDRQWLTISWAMEGAALIWLFRRVPHRGLIGTGVFLLVISFIRLSLNPAVLNYYPRGATAILNWHLYTYGIAAVSMVLGARWLSAPHHRVGEINLRAVLYSLGGVLLFLLLNIEIADYFTEPGSRFITLSFGGANLARDMTYSMAWGIFSLALLITGFTLHAKGARYAGIGLLAVTLLKLFLHDLASLQNIYRIGALMVVAVIALLASFLYQRFLSKNKEQ